MKISATAFAILFLAAAPAVAQTSAPDCKPIPGMAGNIVHSDFSSHKIPPFMLREPYSRFNGDGMLDIEISPDGSVGAVTVTKPSGHDEVDSKYADYVKENWRWEPPLSIATCQPTTAHMPLQIRYGAPR